MRPPSIGGVSITLTVSSSASRRLRNLQTCTLLNNTQLAASIAVASAPAVLNTAADDRRQVAHGRDRWQPPP